MKKLFLLIPAFLLTACNLGDVQTAYDRMPPQRVLTKADLLKMEQLNAGIKEPIIYQTTTGNKMP